MVEERNRAAEPWQFSDKQHQQHLGTLGKYGCLGHTPDLLSQKLWEESPGIDVLVLLLLRVSHQAYKTLL